MKTLKVTNTKVHTAKLKGGIAKGEDAKILDYSTDGGKTWKNHGIYCREMTSKIDRIIITIQKAGVINSRENQVFPVACHY